MRIDVEDAYPPNPPFRPKSRGVGGRRHVNAPPYCVTLGTLLLSPRRCVYVYMNPIP